MKKNISILFLFFTLVSVGQGNYTVTSLSDDLSPGTLRYAIQNSTANTIDFDIALAGTLTLTANLPSINRNITITGNGVNSLTISGDNLYNMFQVSGGAILTISNITFTANASYNGSIFRADNGNSSVVATSIQITGNSRSYAFYTNNPSIITISNSTFTTNNGILFASDYGSTPSNTSDTETDYSNRITVIGSTFSFNNGTIFNTERYVKIDNCIFNNNSGQIGNFRGLNRYQILNSTFTNNTSWSLFSFSSTLSQGVFLPTLGTNHHLFDGNTFTGNTGTVIYPGSANEQSKTTISNNIFTNNGNNWNGSPIVVSNNTLNNFISSVSHSSANSTITVVMNRAVFNTNAQSGDLEANDFQFSLNGGNATLAATTPTSISGSGNTYTLGINILGDIYGTEIITVNPVANSIYDSNTNLASTAQINNTANLKILDDDGDGVANYMDQCPSTLPGDVVEPTTGCNDETPPVIPSNFKSTNGAYKIILNWTPNTDDTAGYKIYKGTDSNSLSLLATLNSPMYSDYNDISLPANELYYYTIIAYDFAGNESVASTIISGAATKPNIWDGPMITFVKTAGTDWTLPENQDFITDNVIITRGNNQGIFNIAKESFFNNFNSPSDTEWARGNTSNFGSLNFYKWRDANANCPPCNIGTDFVLHLITDDIYIDIKILSWNTGNGGFSYQRSTPKPQPTLSNFNAFTKKYHDDTFTITSPTSNSSGDFSYVSSDLSVATITGNTVTITGTGVATITATQEADIVYASKIITTTLTVNAVSVLTKNGNSSETEMNYINNNGSIGTSSGLTKYGEKKATKTN